MMVNHNNIKLKTISKKFQYGNISRRLDRIDDIKLALTKPVTTEELFATETKMPTGIVNVDLVHRVIETNVIGKELAEHIGRNMNEEY